MRARYIAKMGELRAPPGVIELAEVPARDVGAPSTPEANLVSDRNGTPLRLYHGTNQAFVRFRCHEQDGIYFSSDPGYAYGYAQVKAETFGGAPTLRVAHVELHRPLVLDGENELHWERYTQRGFNRLDLLAEGFDGVVMR